MYDDLAKIVGISQRYIIELPFREAAGAPSPVYCYRPNGIIGMK